jgi:diguanylate cyclase (GGDEF)-like protein
MSSAEILLHRREEQSVRGSRAKRLRDLSNSVALDERMLVGRLLGTLYLVGGLSFALLAVVPGVPPVSATGVAVVASLAVVTGVVCLAFVDWYAKPAALFHGPTASSLPLIAAAVAVSGGGRSIAWTYLFFVTGFCAYAYVRPVALVYLAACVVVQALPVVYDAHAMHELYVPALVVAAPAYLALGWTITAARERLERLRQRAETLAAEQAALHRVTAAVAEGAHAGDVYRLVAKELARLAGAHAAGILRSDGGDGLVVMGAWGRSGSRSYAPGHRVAVRAGSDVDLALKLGSPVRVDDHPAGSPTRERLGYRCSVVVPVRAQGAIWGALAVAHPEPSGLPADAEDRAVAFGELLATAIAQVDDRARLAAQACTDPLTGLANHRAVHERLGLEVQWALRHRERLSVAMLDLDGFKQVNDLVGHEEGDRVLARVAHLLQASAREDDTLGRLGGDEFAWVLPRASGREALGVLDRARRAIALDDEIPSSVTLSAGICDLAFSEDPQELVQLADGALYWAKAHGRNSCWVYDPEVVRELSTQERAEHLQRSQALHGLRALARAIDAKDSTTRRHSERVSAVAVSLALERGWSEERARALGDAALVHDVGKIGMPDAVLLKEGPLTPEEYEQVKAHAVLSARIAGEVLSGEQVDWILSHHERPDGTGYPRALCGSEISEGAALLAIADAWDVMTVSRPYSVPKGVEEALQECRSLVDRQFTAEAVQALCTLHREGRLRRLSAVHVYAGT